MSRTQLDRHTLHFQRRWTGAAVGFASIAALVPALAGGADPWFRWIAGLITVGGVLGACRLQTTLHLPMASSLSAAALLPDNVGIEPSIVAGICAVSMLLCAESTAVARRLVTAASVRSVAPDVRAVGLLGAAGAASVVCVGLLGQLERVGGRWLVIGLPVAAAAVVVAVAGSLRIAEEQTSGQAR